MAQVRVKICGITREQDASAAAAAGADAIGLVFYPPSPRYLDNLATAKRIALAVGPFVSTVGLFVDPERSWVETVMAQVPLQLLQFHGNETPEFCASFQRPFLKAVRMKPEIDLNRYFDHYHQASGILLDAYQSGVPGGTGTTFDWARVPQNAAKPIVLAGGLTPDNVAAAIAQTRPYAVDLSGGVEDAPGIKKADKIVALLQNAKGAYTNT